MATAKVGIRELAGQLSAGGRARKRTEAERAALKEAASRVQEALAAEGISEGEVIKDFKRWRRGVRK